ncbi:MAG: glucose/galactose MFS transporter [Prolixibacteraceae bacterium]|nr:MAG: L-fucose-proton symporter [Bacteroidetes bacterium ADurb.Bin123]HNZ69763.1 glucose/galactose MFS transporter [Prolixibacteraceae bacterium]HOC86751.1 glucose/galactose MFS transporter [Prolixibacteraceae bacterium]HOF56434.1 glucose/galactose MFS transporter [Prolixibacteraceae bacterium]HOG96680.1 glucose/galactose MFS transporter [Prolixibacteraceae bacterium]
MKMKNNNGGNRYALPLVIVGVMFFAIGFALGINSYLVPLLNKALQISSGQSYLVIAATFSAFLIFGYPASLVIGKIGYKKTMALSFLMFAVGFYLFIPSAKLESLGLFLLASFISGMGNAFLQASVNPYITILGPIESAAKRMSIMGICNKLAWPVAPLFLALVIGKSVDDVVLTDINLPFYIIIGVFLILGVLAYFSPLPEVKAAGEDPDSVEDCPYAATKTSIWQFPHLLLGALTLFLYVGVETVSLSTLVDYANSLGLPNPDQYAWIASVGMVVGYICGVLFIPKYLSQAAALKICAYIAIAGSLLVVLTPATLSIWFIFLMALGCSLMWPALWPLAIAELGRFTKAGSSLLVVAIVGGAVIPTIFGFLKDGVGAQNAYWICLPCFLFILYYALSGHKIRTARQ